MTAGAEKAEAEAAFEGNRAGRLATELGRAQRLVTHLQDDAKTADEAREEGRLAGYKEAWDACVEALEWVVESAPKAVRWWVSTVPNWVRAGAPKSWLDAHDAGRDGDGGLGR